MAILVIAPHPKAPVVQRPCQGVVATCMFTQPMHDQNHTSAGHTSSQRPRLYSDVFCVSRHNESLRTGWILRVGLQHGGVGGMPVKGLGQGTCEITCATAAVSFLA